MNVQSTNDCLWGVSRPAAFNFHLISSNDRNWVGSSHTDEPIWTTANGPIAKCPLLICNTDKADVVARVSGTSASAPIVVEPLLQNHVNIRLGWIASEQYFHSDLRSLTDSVKTVQPTFLLLASFIALSGCMSNNLNNDRPESDGKIRFEKGASGYATILDAPPAPFMPIKPGQPQPKSAEQRAADQQFMRITKFQSSVMEQVDTLAETLRRKEAGNFVSLYFDNGGDPSVVFQFLKNGSSTLSKYTSHPRFYARTVRWSEADLKAAADFMWKSFRDDRVLQSTGIGRNEVEARISVSEFEFRDLAKRKGVTVPEAVNLVFGSAPVVPLVNPPRAAREDAQAVPPEIAPLIRIFPRDDRIPEMLSSINSSLKIILKDGCFRAADQKHALVLFPFGAKLFVDKSGYLGFGSSEMPGYARVGETVIFMGSINEVKTPALVDPIHAVCGPSKVIKAEGLESDSARRLQDAVDTEAQSIRRLQADYGLDAAQARRAYDWLGKRQAGLPRQRFEDGTLAPPPPPSATFGAPPRPVENAADCPRGSKLSYGLCRTPEGWLRPVPEWLAEFMEQDR